MADNDKQPEPGKDAAQPVDDRLTKMLESRWDPGKMSSFMKASDQSRAQRLDLTSRNRFERRLGVDLGDVRIFSGDLAEDITRAHNAEALTIGDTGMILMRRSSAFAPGTAAGTSLLAHELTHVAQAKPSTISRKKTKTDLAEEDESEQEAETHEAAVKAEEQGQKPQDKESQADKDSRDRDRKERIREKVMLIFEQEEWMSYLRNGGA